MVKFTYRSLLEHIIPYFHIKYKRSNKQHGVIYLKLVLDSEIRNISGPRVRTARLNNNITQKELSIKLETLGVYIDRASISKIEQQNRIIMDIELLALSKVLKVSVNWLLGLER